MIISFFNVFLMTLQVYWHNDDLIENLDHCLDDNFQKMDPGEAENKLEFLMIRVDLFSSMPNKIAYFEAPSQQITSSHQNSEKEIIYDLQKFAIYYLKELVRKNSASEIAVTGYSMKYSRLFQ